MDPLAQAKQLATEILNDLEQEVLDWPGIREKLKLMRDKIGDCQVQYVYGQPVTYTQPSDSEIDGWTYSAANNFAQWALTLE